ncbi:MAG: 30S ribosomal protein S20 [Bacteroidales bacterium]|nr:30S ribosomal protein S20 [Porphyromonas sp.]MDD6933909.1 30S ribosomal protein S20 [Bacteroidales bacterium]MDY3102950.1 30S ribosomal protein S20 [Porphyromonas sp.]
MANHKSSLKRIRQASARRLHNRYYGRTTRNQIKRFRMLTDKDEAKALLPKVSSMIDKLARERIIHKNKAANLKSKLARQVNRMMAA